LEPKKLIVQGIACNIQGRLLQELVFYSLMKKEKRKREVPIYSVANILQFCLKLTAFEPELVILFKCCSIFIPSLKN